MLTINILACVMIVLMCIVILWFAISLVVLYKLDKQHKQTSREIIMLQKDNKEKILEYSQKSLEFIKLMISQIALLKLKAFIDQHDISKVSRSQIEKVVEDVALTVRNNINMQNFQIENTIYTEEYFDQYIIQTSVFIVKKLFDEAVNRASEE